MVNTKNTQVALQFQFQLVARLRLPVACYPVTHIVTLDNKATTIMMGVGKVARKSLQTEWKLDCCRSTDATGDRKTESLMTVLSTVSNATAG